MVGCKTAYFPQGAYLSPNLAVDRRRGTKDIPSIASPIIPRILGFGRVECLLFSSNRLLLGFNPGRETFLIFPSRQIRHSLYYFRFAGNPHRIFIKFGRRMKKEKKLEKEMKKEKRKEIKKEKKKGKNNDPQ